MTRPENELYERLDVSDKLGSQENDRLLSADARCWLPG